jgi:hypothetical protein
VTEADWLTTARDRICAEASKTQPPSFVSVTVDGGNQIHAPASLPSGKYKRNLDF